jgi:hypothetical protein
MSAPRTIMDQLYTEAIQKKFPGAKLNPDGKLSRNCYCEVALAGQSELKEMAEFNVFGGVLYYNHGDEQN